MVAAACYDRGLKDLIAIDGSDWQQGSWSTNPYVRSMGGQSYNPLNSGEVFVQTCRPTSSKPALQFLCELFNNSCLTTVVAIKIPSKDIYSRHIFENYFMCMGSDVHHKPTVWVLLASGWEQCDIQLFARLSRPPHDSQLSPTALVIIWMIFL